MAKCRDCGQEMMDKETSSCSRAFILIDEVVYKRSTSYYDVGERCHDCNIVNGRGNVHHGGCDVERCPACGEQLISCDCKVGPVCMLSDKI